MDDVPSAVDWSRAGRAFSVRRNLRLLLVPPASHLRPVDGLRALSILWVVIFHAGWYIAPYVPLHTYVRLLQTPWMLPVWRGDFGVDVFFVLSGFLIAGMLADEQASTGRLRLGLFYARRLLRLWPALALSVVLHVAVIGDHDEMVWANLLYVSNFFPILSVGMGWLWSLAIEEQFYLLCPWLVRGLSALRTQARIGVLGGIALALSGVAAWVVVAGGFRAVDSEIVVNRDFLKWTVGYDHLYDKPWMRAGPLLAGVAAAYIHRLRGAMDRLAQAGDAAIFGLVAALGVAAVCMHWPLVEHAPRAVEVAYLALYRTGFGVAVAYVLLLSLSQHPVGLFLGRVLSVRALHPLAQLAYSAYLLNPIVTTLVDGALAPVVSRHGWEPILVFMPADVVATFLSAAVVNLLVERPFMELRPRAPSLDAATRLRPSEPTGQAPGMPAPASLHILLAEDDADVRHYVGEALVQAGHVVVAVEDGAAALERLSGATFDLVVSDIRLPGVDGHAILAHARQVSSRTEVILMTSFAAVADAVAAVKKGAHDYLTKPFEVEDLVQKVAALADMHAVDPVAARAQGSVGSLEATVKQAEREHLLKALAVAGGKRTRAAELLGISRKNLWEKLRAHGLSAVDLDDGKTRAR